MYQLRPQMQKPAGEEPRLLSDFPDEPLHLSQGFRDRLSQEYAAEEVEIIPIGPKTKVEEKQNEIKHLFRQIAKAANINHFYFTEDIDQLSPVTK